MMVYKYQKQKTASSHQKIAYLTFDDGPSVYTEDLLNILKERNIPAIFFVVGRHIEEIPNSHDILKRVLAESHHIGLHSMSHDHEKLYSRPDSPNIFVEEIQELQKQLGEILNGYKTFHFRAPYGPNQFTQGHWEATQKAKYYSFKWNIDTRDWELQNSDEIFEHVVNSAENLQFPETVVIVFHEYERTVKVLPAVIDYFHDKGYTFVPYKEGEQITINQHKPPTWLKAKANAVKAKLKKIVKK